MMMITTTMTTTMFALSASPRPTSCVPIGDDISVAPRLGHCTRRGRGRRRRRGRHLPSSPSFPIQTKLHARRARLTVPRAMMGLDIPSVAFSIATFTVMPIYGLLLAAPRSRAARWAASSRLPLLCLSLLYVALVGYCFNRIQPVATLLFSGLESLFTQRELTAIAWIHLLTMDFCVARYVYSECVTKALPMRHSLVFCCLFAPLGYLCHVITAAVCRRTRKMREAK